MRAPSWPPARPPARQSPRCSCAPSAPERVPPAGLRSRGRPCRFGPTPAPVLGDFVLVVYEDWSITDGVDEPTCTVPVPKEAAGWRHICDAAAGREVSVWSSDPCRSAYRESADANVKPTVHLQRPL